MENRAFFVYIGSSECMARPAAGRMVFKTALEGVAQHYERCL